MKNYIGNPLTGKITVQAPPKELNPRMVEAMNAIAYSGINLSSGMESHNGRSTWEVTEAMYIPAINILYLYGYTPAIRLG